MKSIISKFRKRQEPAHIQSNVYNADSGSVTIERVNDTENIYVTTGQDESRQPLNSENAGFALDVAVSHKLPDLARSAIGKGIEPETISGNLLNETIKRGDAATLSVLLDAGANPDARDSDDINALTNSISYDTPEAFKSLLKAGANPNAVNGDGTNALEKAYMYNKPGAFKALLRAGAELNDDIISMVQSQDLGARSELIAMNAQEVMGKDLLPEEIGSYLAENDGFNQVRNEVHAYYAPDTPAQERPRPKNSFVDSVLESRRATTPDVGRT